jgi:phage FluMu protein Com
VIGQTNYSEPLTNPMIDVRCPGCARKLMEWIPCASTWVKIKCRHCKTIVELRHGTVALEYGKVDKVVAIA